MPSGTPKSATPEQIAKYGHTAALIRKYMEERNMRGPAFAEALGMDVKHLAQLYKWMGAKAGPGPMYRKKVAKLLGVPVETIRIRNGSDATDLPSVIRKQNGKVAGDVLQFSINSEGQVRLRFDATLPASKGIPLLKIVLATAELMNGVDGE